VLHDLGNGGDKDWVSRRLTRDLGIRALDSAGGDFAWVRRMRDAAPWRD